MIHHSIRASRRVARIVGALSAPLLAVIGGSLPNTARAGGAAALEPQPPLRGSYCGGSGEDAAAPVRAGCARISGYITAGARFGSDERIGGRRDPFGPIDEPAIARNQASGLTIVGAPLSADRFLAPTSAGEIAR
ncbi:MAG: hypothetical protein WCF81_08875 [Roseiarcus sp.]